MDNKPTNYETLLCDTCGSNDIELVTDEIALCNRCGSKIVIRKEKSDIINNFYSSESNNAEQQGSNLPVITTQVRDAQTFKRDALVSLAMEKNTPPDIFQSQFQPVRTQLTQYARVDYKYTLHISASIGYKKQEEYIDYEIYYVNGQSRKRPVTKTRTVTDWKPYSSELVGESFGFVNLTENIDDGDRVLSFIRKHKGEYDAKFIEETNFQIQTKEVNSSQVRQIVDKDYSSFRNEALDSLPGDTSKDLDVSVDYEVIQVRYLIIPQYLLPYKYNSENYDVRAYKASKDNYLGNSPDNSANANQIFEAKTKGVGIFSIFMSCFSLILAIIFAFVIQSSISLPAIIICLSLSSLIYVLYKIKYKNVKDEVMNEIQNQKLKDLMNYLSHNNLKSLTEQEITRIGWRKS